MPATLYRVSCEACEFSCSTNSWVEAKKVRQFHDNWNSDQRLEDGSRSHVVKVTASVHAYRQGHQVILDELAAVSA